MKSLQIFVFALASTVLLSACQTVPRTTKPIAGHPGRSIEALLHRHEANKGGHNKSSMQIVLKRKDFKKSELGKLDAFAAHVSGDRDCQINAIYGCRSCCNAPSDGGNLVDSTCGWQCWTCTNTCDQLKKASTRSTKEPTTVTAEV